MSRQQQRQQERALAKQGQSAISTGLAVAPQKADVIAVAFVLARTLRDASDPGRASRAAALMHELSVASTKKTPGTARLACAKGCGYCCHTWVAATVPEIVLLADTIRSGAVRDPRAIAGIIERSQRTIGLTPDQRFGARLPCPLLVDNSCSLYRERPAVCRQATSLDLAACIEEFEGKGRGEEMPVSAVYLAHTRNSRVPLTAALRSVGLPARTYELSAGLTRALEQPDAEARWLAAADPFAGVAMGPEEAPAHEQAIGEIVKALAAITRGSGAG